MAEHILRTSIEIDRTRAEVFEFFADAGNLERITPPELGFEILTPQPMEMRSGMLIDYRLRIWGFPIDWRTEITRWDPPFEFEDTQLRGPYSQWIHRHTFSERGTGKTLIEDEVRYRLPFEPFGDAIHFLVRAELEKIFDFRANAVRDIFAGG